MGQRYYKVGQLFQRSSVHLRETTTNAEPYLLIAAMLFENQVV